MTASGHLVCSKIHGRLKGDDGAFVVVQGVFWWEGASGKKWIVSERRLRRESADRFRVLRRSHERCREGCRLPLCPQSHKHTGAQNIFPNRHTHWFYYTYGTLPLAFSPSWSCSHLNLSHFFCLSCQVHWIKTSGGKYLSTVCGIFMILHTSFQRQI